MPAPRRRRARRTSSKNICARRTRAGARSFAKRASRANDMKRAGVRIGTAERDSTFLSQGLSLKNVLERIPALAPVEVSTSGHSSVENANRLEADDIDFGFMASNWIGRAKTGETPFAQKIDPRIVASVYAGAPFFNAPADSALRSVRDMRGQPLVVGPEKSGMAQYARV